MTLSPAAEALVQLAREDAAGTLVARLATMPGRCSGCGFHVATQGCSCPGQSLKFRGQDLAASAHPSDRAKVEAAIRQLAATGQPFSSNEARPLHGVSGPVVGAAFTAMAKAGVIKRIGYVASTDPGTHAHPVTEWIGSAA